MERRKHRGSNLDELAIVKAAAWTWYQHGSGAEGRPMREFDLARAEKTQKPSRYKIEAIRDLYVQEQEDPEQMFSPLISKAAAAGDKKSDDVSLLDTYEIERISRELHFYMESSRIKHLKSFLGGDNGIPRPGYRKVVSLSESGTSEKRCKPKHKTSKGFWPVICGSGHHDVVEKAPEAGRRISFQGSSRRQEKNVPVVKNSSSLQPRGVHAAE